MAAKPDAVLIGGAGTPAVLDADSDPDAGGASYDISWAQDELGQSVTLASIEFVRVEVLSGNAEIDGLVAVPEPTAISLALLGAGALIVARRKRS